MPDYPARPAALPYRPTLNNGRGILWMFGAVTTLTVMFAIIKHLTADLPVFVIALLRTTTALMMLTPWLMRVGLAGVRTKRPGVHFLRAFFGISAFACVVYAASKLLLADVMVLSFTSPLWITIISALFFGEVIRARRVSATIIGFVGVVLIAKPQAGIDPAMAFAIVSALFTAGAMIAMKQLTATEPPTRIVFYFFTFGSLIVLGPAIYTWQWPTLEQWGWVLLTGILGAIGQDWLARAYDAGEVTVVAPFDFLRLPLAGLLGYLVFAEVPDAYSMIGTGVIIASSLYIAHREAQIRRAKAASPPL